MSDKPLVMTAMNHAKFASHSAFYPHAGEQDQKELDYLFLGLAGETGESVDAYKKLIRSLSNADAMSEKEFPGSLGMRRGQILDELGDVYWYLNLLCLRLNTSPEAVMGQNYLKLTTRYKGSDAPHLLGIEGGGIDYEEEEETHA